MTKKMYELSGNATCKKHRNFPHMQTTVPDFAKKSRASTEACVRLLKGEDIEVVKTAFDIFYAELPYPTEASRIGEKDDRWREVLRYVTSEKMMFPAKTRRFPKGYNVELSKDLTVEVTPDFLSFSAGHSGYDIIIEVNKLHAGKAGAVSNGASDLSLYAMILYARKLVKPGMHALITANHLYLRRKDDAGVNAKIPKFETNFFANKGGNIVTLCDDFVNDGKPNALDEAFVSKIKDFLEGVDEDKCKKADCEACELYQMCKYTEPPMKINVPVSTKKVQNLSLTAEQNDAIDYVNGVVRINAGAGVGKTVVVALRAVTLMDNGVEPEEILLITFTNSGAEEMRERIAAYNEDIGTGKDVSKMKICTFNSFGDDILKKEFARFGFSKAPSVIDSVERARIISNLLKENVVDGLDYRNFYVNSRYVKGAVFMAGAVFDLVKKNAYTVMDLQQIITDLGPNARFASSNVILALIELYDVYDQQMRANNLIEFADQELMLVELLQKEPYYLEQFGLHHIIVDEFQDTDLLQMQILKKLKEAPTFESLMVVGDDSQAIFSFRDTTPEFIINFPKYIDDSVDDVYLLNNFRCTSDIIDFANKINELNSNRVKKDLIATRPAGKPVVARGFYDKQSEQAYIIGGVKKHIENGIKPEDIAIICSTKAELRQYASLLTQEGITSVSLNPEPLLENSRVQAAIAFMKFLDNPSDNLNCAIYMNAKIGGGLLEKTQEEIQKLLEEGREDAEYIMPNRFNISEEMDDPNESLADKSEASEDNESAVPSLSDEEMCSRLFDKLKALDVYEDELYLAFLDTLQRKSNFAKIREYLYDFVLFGEKTEKKREHSYPGVTLTTCHSSKGLEWKVVYASITKFDDDLKKYHNHTSNRKEEIEEQNRLLFVTATRAKDELYITSQYSAYDKYFNLFLRNAYLACGMCWDEGSIVHEGELYAKEKARKVREARKAASSPKEKREVAG